VDNVFFHLSNPSPVWVPDEYQTGGTTILKGRGEMMAYLPFACQPPGLPCPSSLSSKQAQGDLNFRRCHKMTFPQKRESSKRRKANRAWLGSKASSPLKNRDTQGGERNGKGMELAMERKGVGRHAS
jgi:hypothetical protein